MWDSHPERCDWTREDIYRGSDFYCRLNIAMVVLALTAFDTAKKLLMRFIVAVDQPFVNNL